MSDDDILRLTEPYRYDGEQTLSIPYTDRSDLGGSVIIKCPDGSVRMFNKGEISDD